MNNNSRTRKSLKNAQVSLFYYVLQLLVGFWSRKVFFLTSSLKKYVFYN